MRWEPEWDLACDAEQERLRQIEERSVYQFNLLSPRWLNQPKRHWVSSRWHSALGPSADRAKAQYQKEANIFTAPTKYFVFRYSEFFGTRQAKR